MADKFVHLHRHSEFSLLDGTGTADDYTKRCNSIGQNALAITDHGVLSGIPHHMSSCLQNDILPILGVEAYFRENRLLHSTENQKSYHLTMWAMSLTGWQNIVKLSSEANISGFYRRPCVDWELLAKYNEGVAISTGCMGGLIPQSIVNDDYKTVRRCVENLNKYFSGRIYAEIMPHDFEDQRIINIEIVKIANENGWPIIATVDAHYPYQDWCGAQDARLMISTNQSLKKRQEKLDNGDNIYKFDVDTLYLSKRVDVEDQFAKYHKNLSKKIVEESCDNTANFINYIDPFIIDRKNKMPRVKVKGGAEQTLKEWCEEGLFNIGKSQDEEYLARFEYEFSILKNKNVLDYFYLVGDVVRWAKENDIRVGIGRGSAAGCLISYLLGITNIDPIAFGLLFERFLNPDRMSMPDIDLDFQHDRREEVKQYLANKWGEQHVVDIGAFQTFGAKSAIKDVSRVYDVPLNEVIPVSDDIDNYETSIKLDDFLMQSSKAKTFSSRNPKVWSHAVKLQGQVKSHSKHPAGVVITEAPVIDLMPTMRSKNGSMVTQFAETLGFNAVTEYGFLKVDILGTEGLTKQKMIIDLVKSRTGKSVNIDTLKCLRNPKEVDEDVMDGWRKGDTFGVFQFESDGITSLLRDMIPSTLTDIAAANALYRPGPLQSGLSREYGNRKNGRSQVEFWHESLRPYMSNTYGILVYQEQVMKVVQELGGFTLAEADTVRKAITKWIGKKGKKYLDKYESKFVNNAVSLGLEKSFAVDIWDKLTEFASYAFNASHAAGYAAQAYQDMLLKVRYPLEFYCALMTLSSDKVPRAIREARRKNIKVLPPNINTSGTNFTVDGDCIRFGLLSIKNVGPMAVKAIIEERANGIFTSIENFNERVPKRQVNAKVKNSLTDSGALDMFGGRDHMSKEEIIDKEIELFGMSLSISTVSEEHMSLIRSLSTKHDDYIKSEQDTYHNVGGEVLKSRVSKTKHGTKMIMCEIDYDGHMISAVSFGEDNVNKIKDVLKLGNVIMIKGRKNNRGGLIIEACSLCEEIIAARKETQ